MELKKSRRESRNRVHDVEWPQDNHSRFVHLCRRRRSSRSFICSSWFCQTQKNFRWISAPPSVVRAIVSPLQPCYIMKTIRLRELHCVRFMPLIHATFVLVLAVSRKISELRKLTLIHVCSTLRAKFALSFSTQIPWLQSSLFKLRTLRATTVTLLEWARPQLRKPLVASQVHDVELLIQVRRFFDGSFQNFRRYFMISWVKNVEQCRSMDK